MSLPNPNLPVTEERLQEFYQQIKSYLGLREMPSGDMGEIVNPLPSVRKGYHRYSTEEQIVGEWIDGRNIYEKTVDCGALPNATTKEVAHGISNLDMVVDYEGMACNPTTVSCLPLPYAVSSSTVSTTRSQVSILFSSSNIRIICDEDRSAFSKTYVTLRYTKTT